MNSNGYYQNPIFPGTPINNEIPNQQTVPSYESSQVEFIPNSSEQSYIENIIRLNKGKKASFFVTIPGSKDWQDKKFEGIIEQAGRDHIIVSNPANGEWYLILIIYLDYVTFDEPINFIKDFK